MDLAPLILVTVIVLLTGGAVIALFIWAAVKDGQEDRALQARLRIHRRTRMGHEAPFDQAR